MRSYQNATVLAVPAPHLESVLPASCLHLPERQRHRILTHQGSSLLRAVKPIQMSRARWVLVMEQGSMRSYQNATVLAVPAPHLESVLPASCLHLSERQRHRILTHQGSSLLRAVKPIQMSRARWVLVMEQGSMRSYQNATVLAVLAPHLERVLPASCLHLPERQRHRILTHQGSSLLRAVKPIQMSRARWVLVMEQGSMRSYQNATVLAVPAPHLESVLPASCLHLSERQRHRILTHQGSSLLRAVKPIQMSRARWVLVMEQGSMRSYQNATLLAVLAPHLERVLPASCLHLPERQRHRILTHQGSSLLRAVRPIQMSRARWVLVMEQGSMRSYLDATVRPSGPSATSGACSPSQLPPSAGKAAAPHSDTSRFVSAPSR